MPNKITKFFIFFFLTLIPIANSYSIGYGAYGMNHQKSNELLKSFNQSLFDGIDIIIFTNSKCTGQWGGYCNAASYTWKGNHNEIIIGNWDKISLEEATFLMNHELCHHKQITENPWHKSFFTIEEEETCNEQPKS